MKLVLASASPARAMLMRNAGLKFEVKVSGVDEEGLQTAHADLPPAGLPAVEIALDHEPEDLAGAFAQFGQGRSGHGGNLVVGLVRSSA